MILKITSDLEGDHIQSRFYIGEDEDLLVFIGGLTFRVGWWQIFGAALLMGAERTQGHLRVLIPDDKRIVEELAQRQRATEILALERSTEEVT